MFPRVGLFQAVELRTLNGGSLPQHVSKEYLEELTAVAVKAQQGAPSKQVIKQIKQLHCYALLGSVSAKKYFEDKFIETFAARGHVSLTFDDALDVWGAINEVSRHSLDVKFLQDVFDNNCGLNERIKFSPQDGVACDVDAGFNALRILAHHPQDKTAAAAAAMRFSRLYAAELEPVAASFHSITKAYQLEMLRNAFSPMKNANAFLAERNWVTYRELGVFSAERDLLCMDPHYINATSEQQICMLQEARARCKTVVEDQCDYYLCLAIENMLEAGVDAFVTNQVAYIDYIQSSWIDAEARSTILDLLCERFEGHEVVGRLKAILAPEQEPEVKRLCL